MKNIWIIVTIIIVIVLIILGAYLIPKFSLDELNKILPINELKSYDCAKEFDKFATVAGEYWYGGVFNWRSHIMDFSSINNPEIYDFVDNRCYTTYKSWMQFSDYEYFIKKFDFQFQEYSYMEQMYNGEIECIDRFEYICDRKEMSIIIRDSWNKHCNGIDENSSQQQRESCFTGFYAELEKIDNSKN